MFDRTDDYEEKIKPILKELNRMCVICGIPYFAAFCVKDMDGKTSYRNVLYSASNSLQYCLMTSFVNTSMLQTDSIPSCISRNWISAYLTTWTIRSWR